MAIEIAPKKRKKAKLINYGLYLSLALLVASLLAYAFLYYSVQGSNKKLANLKEQLTKTETPEKEALEKEILEKREKINRFSKLVDSHLLTSQLFTLLESLTHDKVMFTSFKLSLDNKNISLSGKTDTFENLGEQILLFNESKRINNLELSDLSVGEEGKVKFNLSFSFNKEVLR